MQARQSNNEISVTVFIDCSKFMDVCKRIYSGTKNTAQWRDFVVTFMNCRILKRRDFVREVNTAQGSPVICINRI